MSEPTYDAPLADLVVLDLTRALAGPQAAMMLGDLGARVIKVESATGDDTRAWGPPWAGDPGPEDPHDSTYFMSANRNKESIVLDLKAEDDRAVLERLVPAVRRAAGELPHRRARPARLPRRAAARAQPGAGDRLDQRVRARRAGGRPRGLRPDRPGRGRPDERHRRRRADQGGRADRRPAGRHEPRVRRPGRAPRTLPHRPGPRRAHLAARRASSACTPSRAPAGPSPARCRA